MSWFCLYIDYALALKLTEPRSKLLVFATRPPWSGTFTQTDLKKIHRSLFAYTSNHSATSAVGSLSELVLFIHLLCTGIQTCRTTACGLLVFATRPVWSGTFKQMDL